MRSRRSFLQTSTAAFAAVVAASRGAFALSEPHRNSRIHAVVVDERIAECRDFANAAAEQNIEALLIRGEVGELWYSRLRASLESQPMIVAGLTLDPAAAYLKSLARDVTYQQIYRGEHIIGSTHVLHRLNGPDNIEQVADRISDTFDPWAKTLAAAMSDMQLEHTPRARKTAGTQFHTRSDDTNRLVSWVIAPIYA